MKSALVMKLILFAVVLLVVSTALIPYAFGVGRPKYNTNWFETQIQTGEFMLLNLKNIVSISHKSEANPPYVSVRMPSIEYQWYSIQYDGISDEYTTSDIYTDFKQFITNGNTTIGFIDGDVKVINYFPHED